MWYQDKTSAKHKNQLLRIADALCQSYNDSDSNIITYVPENTQKHIHLQKDWYQTCEYLPFENIILPVPKIMTLYLPHYMATI